jgi:hypothetical protein
MAGFGRAYWQNARRAITLEHLKTIGGALDAHHEEKGAFPPGGVFEVDRGGRMRGYHGWMTFLLPYLGEQPLFRSIRLNRPWDDQANREPLSRDVSAFFASGGSREKVRGRYGVTHFSAVGGEADAESESAHIGLFGVNSAVTRDDVTDGLSQTLAAGEIATELPAWGEPENWRTIGRGLNRDANGFGNHDRSGACFLMADGSVRFFSNKTSPQVLERLSTRDAGDNISRPRK